MCQARTTTWLEVRRRNAGGFTLIEVMVVIIILALLSSMIVPRLMSNRKREFRLAAERVSDLLLMFAQRHSTSRTPVGLALDVEQNWLYLMRMESEDESSLVGSTWVPDTVVKPVKLPSFDREPLAVTIRTDGMVTDISEWPLSTKPGRDRPQIDVVLEGPNGLFAMVVLAPHAIGPDLIGFESRRRPRPASIDLDAIGRSREDW